MGTQLNRSHWTVEVLDRKIHHGPPPRRVVRAKLTLSATEANTYPATGGILLPSYGQFGLARNIDRVMMYGSHTAPSGSYVWQLHPSSMAIYGYQGPTALNGSLQQLPTTWMPSTAEGNPVFYVEVEGR